jgi:hypothetical protein
MRVELTEPESAIEPRLWVEYQQVLALVVRSGSVEWGLRRPRCKGSLPWLTADKSLSDNFRIARHSSGIVRTLGRSFRLLEVRHSWSTEHRPLFRPRSLFSGLERGNRCSRCHSKSLPESSTKALGCR